MSSPEKAFQELARIFHTRNNRVLEIEILLPPLGPLLHDDCSVGITKKYLVQAFVAARRIFFEKTRSKSECGTSRATAQDENESAARECWGKSLEELLVSTEIILLFDCEHLTACNWRRRRLVALKRHHGLLPDNTEPFIQALVAELSLMTTYLCSPLHRHTKSPTLWQHRLWVLNQLLQIRGTQSLSTHRVNQRTHSEQGHLEQESAVNLLRTELAIVLRAGELHPRNYYAFSYIRQVHNALTDAMEEISEGTSVLTESILDLMLHWSLAHPSDISGWMFMFYLLESVPQGDFRLNTVTKVVRYALDVGWEGESLWIFLDLSIKTFGFEEIVSDTMQRTPRITFTTTVELADGTARAIAMPERCWKTWLAMARAYWTDHNKVM
ncbi:hypothetical protein ETB97_002286 [Aspergillus alliaceus]|uniref:Uncharacterized protein n=1 Tax=Petromyces alliaceus TaxID=209559 RepID=A0A5N6FFX2_PETAA|nr:uncharacterized protein BDW43DRAFT_215813 [Aspergillus alliaceus]KAB8228477.1 hypothetical protein BDW43DRAFT_215813 [Aspergillus alliaceus]KAF5865773.1 hypothetical protein ETB97_002286 [Aspergillus burnettii]